MKIVLKNLKKGPLKTRDRVLLQILFKQLAKGLHVNQDLNSPHSIDGNLSQLKDSELHILLRNRVADERKLTHQILLLIAEVDSRKLYLPMAYPSLFEYLVHGIGYTPASAQRRIDSARLMKQVAELGDKIESGSIKLTQVSQVQQVLRLVEKRDKTQLLPSEKKELLQKLENKTGPESELILAQEFNILPQAHCKQKIQRDESVRIELTLSKEQMEMLNAAKALLSHAHPGATLAEVIASLAERYVKQKTGGKSTAKTSMAMTSTDVASTDASSTIATSTTEAASGQNKPVPASIKKAIIGKSDGCHFQDPKTGKICGSQHFPEVDHIQPRFAGGGNEPTNLRQLCSQHNQYRYRAGC